jgi:hypothetical protein
MSGRCGGVANRTSARWSRACDPRDR